MGVTGLWQILQPCARPIKIETLNRKRLAVDASIWIYQFLKAVRDKEGNALRNSHVVGFFRRICKLLFFGIKPVFVFDGGAPVLKRQTVLGRKKRREGRREDAVRTAGRLLAVQMQRRAEEEERERRDHRRNVQEEEEVDEQNLVYVDEIQMSAQERQENRRFRKKDAYHLPNLDVSLSEMGAPNDPRIMSLEELEAYARQFDTGEDINVYDFSKIDYDSPFFMSLPASDRYNILNAARLRSRLRMGHSKEQLDTMFPDRMAFSRFQIERVAERNELTQRLMNINDPNNDLEFGINGTGRVAGEKGREYVLVRNDGVEGGWALGVVSNEGRAERPIDVDKPAPVIMSEDEASNEEDFEDVPIEGLNRLPKRPKRDEDWSNKQRKSVYQSRARAAGRPRKVRRRREKDQNSLFVAEESSDEGEPVNQDEGSDTSLFGEDEAQSNDDEDLNRAIALSLQKDEDQAEPESEKEDSSDEKNTALDLFQQNAVAEAAPVPHGNARAIANALNNRAHKAAPEGRVLTSFGVPIARNDTISEDDDDDDDDEVVDFQAAMKQSKGVKRKQPASSAKPVPALRPEKSARTIAKDAGFSGPLPFEKLDLGSSLLGKKKMQQRTEEAEGGFINPDNEAKKEAAKRAEPLPPWFTGDLAEDMKKQKAIEDEDREKSKQFSEMFQFQQRDEPSRLRRYDTDQVIDLEADDDAESGVARRREIIDLDKEDSMMQLPEDAENTHGEIQSDIEIDAEMKDAEDVASENSRERRRTREVTTPPIDVTSPTQPKLQDADNDSDGIIEWDASDDEISPAQQATIDPRDTPDLEPEQTDIQASPEREQVPTYDEARSRSPSLDFEDVDMNGKSTLVREGRKGNNSPIRPPNMSREETIPGEDDFDDFSDPEEEELLKALTLEAEEHARFASSLNNKSHAENIAEYEKELKQLRNQQKKDRRDADEVTHVMVQECQHLLRLFGLPYVTAPMEAEAQCAELVRLGLVDGIVTDDSDCFLFGGTRVYKNMFNQAKFVECYLNSDLQKEFDLSRDKLIQIAQLLGSDYTEGLPGVGPVTALEIISEFSSLEDFKSWLMGVQLQQITKEDDKDHPFRKKFRRQATKLMLPSAFPDARVELAYLEPEVDSDPEAFQWGVPDLEALRNFLMATIGWSAERTDEVLVPVIRDMNRRMDEGTQSNITAFFDGTVGVGASAVGASKGEAFAPRRRMDASKRMGKALGRMAEQAQTSRESARKSDGDNDPGDGNDENTAGSTKTPTKGRDRQARRRAARLGVEA